MTKEDIKAAILAFAERNGRTPSQAEFVKAARISRRIIRNYFGTYNHALEQCGLQGRQLGSKVRMEDLFRDWAGIARSLKKLPTLLEYEFRSKYSVRPLYTRFGGWLRVAPGLKLYAEEHGVAEEWKDVLEMIEQRTIRPQDVPAWSNSRLNPHVKDNQPVYGQVINGWPMVFAPTNEAGVLFLFGAMAEELGFLALKIQTGYPDCEAMRVVGENKLQRVDIELEYHSRNFQLHRHDVSRAQLIVCWEHNWPESPLEVIELKSAVEELAKDAGKCRCRMCRKLARRT